MVFAFKGYKIPKNEKGNISSELPNNRKLPGPTSVLKKQLKYDSIKVPLGKKGSENDPDSQMRSKSHTSDPNGRKGSTFDPNDPNTLSIQEAYHPFIFGNKNQYLSKILAYHANVSIVMPSSCLMKDEIFVNGDIKEVQAVKLNILKLYKSVKNR